MELKQEEFKAGYNYVRIVRALGYGVLVSGAAASVVTLGLGLAGAASLRLEHSSQRDEIREEIVKLAAEQQKAIAEAAELEKTNQAAALAAYTGLHSQYEAALKVAVTEVGKLFAEADKKVGHLQIGAVPHTSQAAEATGKSLETVMESSADFKALIYQKIEEGYKKLLEPLMADYRAKMDKIKSLESQIEDKQREIAKIKSTQKDGSIRTVIVGKHVVPIENVYNAQTDDDVAPYQRVALSVLPNGALRLPSAEDNAAVAGEVKKLKSAITSLQNWLPYMEDGKEKEEREDAVTLTSQQRARISTLMIEIDELNEKIEALRQELEPIEQKIAQLQQSHDLVVNKTSQTLVGVWHIDQLLGELRHAAAALTEALADAEQSRLQAAARQRYENMITEKETEIAALHSVDALASNAVLGTMGCAGISSLALAWLVWGLLLVHADSFVSRLVVASRLQFDKGLRHDEEES